MTQWRSHHLLPAIFLVLSSAPALADIGAVGQIQPAGGIIDLGGNSGSVITSVQVKLGDQVKQGQLLMTIDDPNLSAGHKQAASQLERARKSAAEQVAAQRLSVKLAEQHAAQARREYAAYKALGAHSTSAREMGRMKDAAAQAELTLQMEKTKLNVSEANAANDIAGAERRAKLSAAGEEIRAPLAGTILSVDRRVGGKLSGSPAVRMGDLTRMVVVCQVYEGDLLKLNPGMKAVIKSTSLPQAMRGTVESVGRMIDTRAKLGEVRISLAQAYPASKLVGMEVEVTIAQ